MNRHLLSIVLTTIVVATTVEGGGRLPITAAGLRADVSFLASDVLQGRATPSPGLDVAAEYIAAQFRRAGLEPVGDQGYFQTARYVQVTPRTEGLALEVESGGTVVKADPTRVAVQEASPVEIDRASVVVVALSDAGAIERLKEDQVRDRVLVVDVPDTGSAASSALRRMPAALAALRPKLMVILRTAGGTGAARPRLREESAYRAAVPVLVVSDAGLRKAITGAGEVRLSARVPAPTTQPVVLRNVAGLLRGSDPTLRDTYVVMSAHYDHVGVRATGEGDRIFNGANDNASGVATVVATGSALASLPRRPKRSILFLALYGEESGGLGSAYYCQHPIVPLDRTVADINLEQIGRVDDNEGPRRRQFNLTGFDYTDLASTFARAGRETGVRVVKHERNSDGYFAASDNAAFSARGIPSTTISVAYSFPDYHQVGDEWTKMDFDNMAAVAETIARGVLRIATESQPPRWNTANPKVAPYVRAREPGPGAGRSGATTGHEAPGRARRDVRQGGGLR